MLQVAPTTGLIQTLSSAVLALFTVVLAIATWRYYKQTESQTNEMVRSRELTNEPVMKAGMKPYHGPNFCLAFINIGGGIAQDVRATYRVEGLDELERTWGTQVHFPEDQYLIGLPIDDSSTGVSTPPDHIESKLNDEGDVLVIEWEYENSSGTEFNPIQKFSITEKIEERTESTEFYMGNEREVRF